MNFSQPFTPPFPGSSWSEPEGTGANGVMILGEALGEMEAHDHKPFRPYAPAGSVLERAIRRCGFSRDSFVLWNVCPVRPEKNWLEGAPWEAEAVSWGLPFIREAIAHYQPRVILALGNVAMRVATGVAGERLGVSSLRGYVLPSQFGDAVRVVPSYHPSFLRRGEMALFSVLMHDIKLAVAAAYGPCKFFSPVLWRDFDYAAPPVRQLNDPLVPPGYVLHPTEADAEAFLREAERAELIAYDIETPRSAITTEDESDELGDVDILSIQLSTRPDAGIFLPWREPFVGIARAILALDCDKAGTNTWRFDDPLLRAHKAPIRGRKHDVRWLWHHLQPDLRASLQFISSFYANATGPWKHLHETSPMIYGIRDVDVIQHIMRGAA